MKTTAVVALALTSVLAVSGCGGGGDKGAKSPATVKPASDTSTDGGIVSPKHLPTAPKFTNAPQGVISDIKVTSCSTSPGPVTAKGTATNSGKFARSIVITMNWAAPGGGDVVARGIAVMKNVAPGKSADWSIKTTLKSTVQVQCVPTAQAGQLKS